MTTLTVAAYNLRKGGARGVHWTRLIDGHGADLLLVQESYPPDRHLPPDAPGWAVWAPVPGRGWGSAVWSRTGPVRPTPVPDFEGWVVGAEVGLGADALLVFSLHAPGGHGSYVNAVDRILDRLAVIADGREILLGGDFNMGLAAPPDGSRPLTGREAAIRARLADEFGLVHCWTAANPDLVPAQTLRWTSNPTTPYHCDGLFVPESWRGRLESCRVLSGGEWDALSDHNPVLARFAAAEAHTRKKRPDPQDDRPPSSRLGARDTARVRRYGESKSSSPDFSPGEWNRAAFRVIG